MIYARPWYMYDEADKRLLLGLIQMCQSTRTLWIGPLAPLNVETGTNASETHTHNTLIVILSFFFSFTDCTKHFHVLHNDG